MRAGGGSEAEVRGGELVGEEGGEAGAGVGEAVVQLGVGVGEEGAGGGGDALGGGVSMGCLSIAAGACYEPCILGFG